MEINREDVVQSALNVVRWCKYHYAGDDKPCKCPFQDFDGCALGYQQAPWLCNLEEFLRTRGVHKDEGTE